MGKEEISDKVEVSDVVVIEGETVVMGGRRQDFPLTNYWGWTLITKAAIRAGYEIGDIFTYRIVIERKKPSHQK